MVEEKLISTRPYAQKMINPLDFDKMIQKLRGFFIAGNYRETFPQHRVSIMAACEDPKTITPYVFSGIKWPMIQTNQMWLEFDLLSDHSLGGVYSLTTSYRDEPNPIDGRHMKIFPMFEAEHTGDYQNLIQTLSDLCVHLGFVKNASEIPLFTYDELCEKYGVSILESEHEEMMWEEYGDVIAITYFPERTSPFWNMKHGGVNSNGERTYHKCDFIICGQETIGAAERETDIDVMRHNFHTISDGKYAEILYDKFGTDRVIGELDDYFKLKFIQRWGFGCGLTRLHRAMKIKGLV